MLHEIGHAMAQVVADVPASPTSGWLESAANYVLWIGGITGGCTGAWFALRRTRKRYSAGKRKVEQLFDTIVGSDAIVHPETGAILRAAQPPLGTRVANLEDAFVKLTRVAEVEKRVGDLEERTDAVEGRMDIVEQHLDLP